MRNERLEAACRESASWIERFVEEEVAREAVPLDSSESDVSSEGWQELRRILLEHARDQLERAEKHARLREKMEPYL